MAKKMSHKAANYGASTSAQKRCGTCSMYSAGKGQGQATCTLVERPIRPSDVCNYFEPKSGGRP